MTGRHGGEGIRGDCAGTRQGGGKARSARGGGDGERGRSLGWDWLNGDGGRRLGGCRRRERLLGLDCSQLLGELADALSGDDERDMVVLKAGEKVLPGPFGEVEVGGDEDEFGAEDLW